MQRVLSWMVGAVLWLGMCAPASGVESPESHLAGTGGYRVYLERTMEVLREAQWELRLKGEEALYSVAGQGQYGKETEPVQWTAMARFLLDDPSQLLESTRALSLKRLPDHPFRTIRRKYDPLHQDFIVTVTHAADPGHPLEKQFSGVPGAVTRETLPFVISRWLLEGQPQRTINLVTDEPSLYRLQPIVRGRETVTVPDGTFQCFKVELVPELEWLRWLGSFLVPKLLLWHTIEPPHHWVQYDGVEAGRLTRRVVIERTALLAY